MPGTGDSIWVRQDDGSWRPAIWREAKGEGEPANGDLIFVTYEDGLGDEVGSFRIQPRSDDQPPQSD
jgi:hypothetical protein